MFEKIFPPLSDGLRRGGCIYAKVLPDMEQLDWTGIREGLRDARLTAGLEEKDLVEQGVCSLANVYRIENVTERPTHKVSLALIDRWLRVTTEEPVSRFLARYERLSAGATNVNNVTSPVTVEVDNATQSLPPAWEARRHGSVVGSRTSPVLPDLTLYEARLFQRFALITLRAAGAAVTAAEDRSTPEARSAGGETPDRDGGPPPLSGGGLAPDEPPPGDDSK